MVQWILGTATLLGGVSAAWFFWDKIAGWWKHDQAPHSSVLPLSQNPTHEEIARAILASGPKDWVHKNINAGSVASFRRDANLRFQMEHSEQGIQRGDFREPWANRHPDQSATGYWCDLYYGATIIERFVLVAVDGARALLPMPKRGLPGERPDSVLPLDYQVARIFDTLGTLDEYMRRSGLKLWSGAV